jgi:hypothetical protein
MKILENEILVEFDEGRQEIITYRLTAGSDEKVLHTVYSLSNIQSKGFGESARLIGEDILISLKGTREKLIDGENLQGPGGFVDDGQD